MAKSVGEKEEALWGRKRPVAIDRQRQSGVLTSRLHLHCHISSGPEAHYGCASSVWFVSKGDHLIAAEDWFMTSFPMDICTELVKAPASVNWCLRSQRHIHSCSYLRFTDVKTTLKSFSGRSCVQTFQQIKLRTHVMYSYSAAQLIYNHIINS